MSLHSKTNPWWLLGAAAIAAVAIAAASPNDDEARAAPLLTGPLVVRSCEYYCRSCGGDIKHEIIQSIHQNAHADHLENCNPGGCGSHSCGIETLLMAESESQRISDFSDALMAAKNRDVRAVLARFADVARYNPARGSVQVFCDAGFVVANIPLSPRAVAYLAE